MQHCRPQVATHKPKSLESAALVQVATVGKEQDEVVKGLAVTLLTNSEDEDDVAKPVFDVIERAPQHRGVFWAIHVPPGPSRKT